MSFLLFELDHQLAGHLRCSRFQDVMVVAVRTEFVSLFKFANVFAECLFALFAGHHELHTLQQLVVVAEHIFVALGTVEPLFAAGGPDGNLGVQNVLAHFLI